MHIIRRILRQGWLAELLSVLLLVVGSQQESTLAAAPAPVTPDAGEHATHASDHSVVHGHERWSTFASTELRVLPSPVVKARTSPGQSKGEHPSPDGFTPAGASLRPPFLAAGQPGAAGSAGERAVALYDLLCVYRL